MAPEPKRPRGAHFAGPEGPSGTYRAPLHARPDETSVFLNAAALREEADRQRSLVAGPAITSEISADAIAEVELDELAESSERSSNMVSVLVIISRITGFLRTSAQAWAIGLTMLSSCYTLAAQLPNVLYELVMGGMLITSFLPVYIKVRERAGREGASAYASSLLSFVLGIMILLTIVSFIFAGPIIWTQSAGAQESFDFDLTVWFFRWFAAEVALYALSSIFSGVLNAERDYLWSNAAPIFNNIITISSFVLFGVVTHAGIFTQEQAMIILAIGNPLGVAVQVLVQIPALRRHGVRFSPRIDFHDPALRDTLSIGLPTLVVTAVAYPTNAVMSSSLLSVVDTGTAIAYYSRVWYVLPFSIFAIPISTTLFTDLSSYFIEGKMDSYVATFARGMSKILFTLIPFTMYFFVFSNVLIYIIAAGAFTPEQVSLTGSYMAVLSLTLPLYGLASYLQKACSAILSMKFYAGSVCVAAVVQIVMCLALTPVFGLYVVPFSSAVYYGIIDVFTVLQLRHRLGALGLRSVAVSIARSLLFGVAGAAVGWLILQVLTVVFGPCTGVLSGIVYAAVAGLPSLVVTFGVAMALGKSDAPFFDAIFGKVLRIVRRGRA